MGFREKLIKLRDENKLSQQEFADMLDVSRQTVSRWEAGKSIPSANQISNICSVFHIRANDLFDTGDEPPAEPKRNNADGTQDTHDKQDASDARSETEVSQNTKKKLNIILLAVIGVLLLVAVAGLIITIVYAVKDAAYDTGSTVWIVAIPQNTPFVILSVFIAIFIALLVALLIYFLRGKKK